MAHHEGHRSDGVSWLRAMVMGANDGIVSVASLVVGVVAADPGAVLIAGIAGLVAGALSMAVGEYVSVSAQADAERADIAKERWELKHEPDDELRELTSIWRKRGLSADLAHEVAHALHEHNALEAHLRDELGITEENRAQPVQAALASAVAFVIGGGVPVLTTSVAPPEYRLVAVGVATLVALVALGAVAARVGGAPLGPAVLRVPIGGAAAMTLSYAIGSWVGVAL